MAYDLEVPFRSWDEESLGLLEQLEPTGEGNPAPVFLLSGASVQTMRRVGRDLSHLQVTLLDRDNTPVRGIAFSQGEEADRPRDGADLLYRPYLNEFRGRRSVEARIFALR
jgi:single-stranded-DNA-specific exonuclease